MSGIFCSEKKEIAFLRSGKPFFCLVTQCFLSNTNLIIGYFITFFNEALVVIQRIHGLANIIGIMDSGIIHLILLVYFRYQVSITYKTHTDRHKQKEPPNHLTDSEAPDKTATTYSPTVMQYHRRDKA